MTCPLCSAELTHKFIKDLTVCPQCARTVAIKAIVVATDEHTKKLSVDEVKSLKALRRVG